MDFIDRVLVRTFSGKSKHRHRSYPEYQTKTRTTTTTMPEENANVLPETQDVCEFLEALMRIDSTSGREVSCEAECVSATFGNALAEWLQSHGWWLVKQPVSHGLEERYNIFATRQSYTTDKQPTVILNTHIDTVPPYIPPTREGNVLKGRGACDAKAMVAGMCFAANRIAKEQPKLVDRLGLLFVVSEENGHYGMMEANKLHLSPEYMIVGEPTEMKWAVGHKGVLNIRLETFGKAAHSGYPEQGESAVDKLLDVLTDIRREQWPASDRLGSTTINIGLIQGGQAVNALAERAEATLLFRVVNPVQELIEQIKKVVGTRAEINVGSSCSSPTIFEAPPDKPTTVVAFGTDAPYLQCKFTKSFLYGPGSIRDAHSQWEYIRLEDLQQATQDYYELAIKLLASEAAS